MVMALNILFQSIFLTYIFHSGIAFYGRSIGNLTSLAHDVSGEVFIVDDHRIRLRHFYYDGTGPATNFWIGLRSKNDDIIDSSGLLLNDEDNSDLILKKYVDADITLILPNKMAISQIRWLAIWCRKFQADFGHIYFPKNLYAPRAVRIGSFRNASEGVNDSGVVIKDSKTFLIHNFNINDLPEVYFAAAIRSEHISGNELVVRLPVKNTKPSEKGSGFEITLSLPNDLSVFDVSHLFVFSSNQLKIFAQLPIPNDPNIPPSYNKAGYNKVEKAGDDKVDRASYNNADKANYIKADKAGYNKADKASYNKGGYNKADKAGYNKSEKTNYDKADKASYNKAEKSDYNKANKAGYNKRDKASYDKVNKADKTRLNQGSGARYKNFEKANFKNVSAFKIQ